MEMMMMTIVMMLMMKSQHTFTNNFHTIFRYNIATVALPLCIPGELSECRLFGESEFVIVWLLLLVFCLFMVSIF